MSRIEREIKHGKKILEDAEFFWGWGTPAGKERMRRRAELLIEHGNLKEGAIVLELGCGTGLYTQEIEKSGAAVVPIDISVDLLRKARQRVLGAYYINTDAHCLPFADSSFNAVVGVSILHHLDMKNVLRESVRVLRSGGRFIFTEPNMMNPQILVQKNVPFIKRLLGDSPDETAFWKWSLRREITAVGFKVIRIVPFDFLHPWIPKPLITAIDKAGRLAEKVPLLRELAGSLLIVAEKA